MTLYEVAMKELDTKQFPQHTIADLISGIIAQSGEAFMVEGNKHTHTRTQQVSKTQISSQVFFNDFVDKFGTTKLKNGFLQSRFLKTLSIDFKIATNIETGPSKKYS